LHYCTSRNRNNETNVTTELGNNEFGSKQQLLIMFAINSFSAHCLESKTEMLLPNSLSAEHGGNFGSREHLFLLNCAGFKYMKGIILSQTFSSSVKMKFFFIAIFIIRSDILPI
jgi:hypothetical protein